LTAAPNEAVAAAAMAELSLALAIAELSFAIVELSLGSRTPGTGRVVLLLLLPAVVDFECWVVLGLVPVILVGMAATQKEF
jgi:hypothetical protein